MPPRVNSSPPVNMNLQMPAEMRQAWEEAGVIAGYRQLTAFVRFAVSAYINEHELGRIDHCEPRYTRFDRKFINADNSKNTLTIEDLS